MMSQQNAPSSLLLIGIHREELAFGQEVARKLDPAQVAVLTIPDGISGKRPLPDQLFRYRALHRALYLQLLPHVQGRHRLLIDLHTGLDPDGPSADLICADPGLCKRLEAEVKADDSLAREEVRVIPLGAETQSVHARTVIPKQIWKNPDFYYLCIEIYLPDRGQWDDKGAELALKLIDIAAGTVKRPPTANSAS